MSKMKATETPSTESVAASRTRRAPARRMPSADSPGSLSSNRVSGAATRDLPPREETSAPRSSAIGGRRPARSAGHTEASTGIAVVNAQHASRGTASAPPGGRSLIVSSSPRLGPDATHAPAATPRAPAGSATIAASIAWLAAMCPRLAPIARRTPMPARRRWTSARAEAASMTVAVSRAIAERATSSAMTIPAAWSRSTRTPSRVTSRRPRIP